MKKCKVTHYWVSWYKSMRKCTRKYWFGFCLNQILYLDWGSPYPGLRPNIEVRGDFKNLQNFGSYTKLDYPLLNWLRVPTLRKCEWNYTLPLSQFELLIWVPIYGVKPPPPPSFGTCPQILQIFFSSSCTMLWNNLPFVDIAL